MKYCSSGEEKEREKKKVISGFIDSFKLPISFHTLKMRPLGIDNNTVKKTSGHACQKFFGNTLSGKFTATSFIGLPVEVNRS